jgi:hypothetical protein
MPSIRSASFPWNSETTRFLRGGIVIVTPNSRHGASGYPFLSGSSPLTCLARKALSVTHATTSIALGIIWPYKFHHYTKLGIVSGGRLWGDVLKFCWGRKAWWIPEIQLRTQTRKIVACPPKRKLHELDSVWRLYVCWLSCFCLNRSGSWESRFSSVVSMCFL